MRLRRGRCEYRSLTTEGEGGRSLFFFFALKIHAQKINSPSFELSQKYPANREDCGGEGRRRGKGKDVVRGNP
jgi:hypothetical protein